MKLTVLIDNFEYIKYEVYQSQLHEELSRLHTCSYVTINDIKRGVLPTNENVFIAMRFRNVVRNIELISNWLKSRVVVIQDYDPWAFYDDFSLHKNGYQCVVNNIENVKFAVPNNYWANLIEQKTGVRTYPFRIGASPKQCSVGKKYSTRKNYLEFRGSKYEPRTSSIIRLQQYIPLKWNEKKTPTLKLFREYLDDLQIWAHDESSSIVVDGQLHCRNWLWPKALEVLSRGCFVIRDKQQESAWYRMNELPTCMLYDNITEAPDMLEKLNKMPESERSDRIEMTVKNIVKHNVYVETCNQMNNWWK